MIKAVGESAVRIGKAFPAIAVLVVFAMFFLWANMPGCMARSKYFTPSHIWYGSQEPAEPLQINLNIGAPVQVPKEVIVPIPKGVDNNPKKEWKIPIGGYEILPLRDRKTGKLVRKFNALVGTQTVTIKLVN